MQLSDNKLTRLKSFILAMISILMIVFINSNYGSVVVSIYNRHPLLIIILLITLFASMFLKINTYIYIVSFSYYILYGLLIYRLIFEMNLFNNLSNFNIIYLFLFIISIIIFIIYNYIIFNNKQ